MFPNTNIIITTNNYKKELLKEFNKELLNIKIYTLNEFNKLYYYDYSKETIIYIMNNYKMNKNNVIYDIAKIYLDNLIYIEDKQYTSTKLNFLSKLKKDLLDNNLLKINLLFKESLKNKNIVIYNLPNTKELNILIKELNTISKIDIINTNINSYKNHIIYKFKTIEEEVLYIANNICELILKGIDIKHIYITNLNDEYYKLIRRIFPMYNIPLTLENNTSIYGTYIVNKFLELYSSNMEETLSKLKEYITDEESEYIYNQILNIVNNYAFINNYDEVLECIKTDIKNTKLKTNNIVNSIHESSIDNIYSEEDYVFLLSFNQGVIPLIHKDELYLTDRERKELNISLTVDKNNIEKEQTINYLSNIKNLIITTKKYSNGEEFQLPSINNILNYQIIELKEDISNYSNLYNKIKLTSLKDEYTKYGTTSNELFLLDNTYKDLPYNSYNNNYNQIDKNLLKKYLNNELKLSYTSIDRYFSCPFSYYLGNILKLNIYEDSFSQKIGNLFHAILEKFNKVNKSYDELWQEELNNLDTSFNNKELLLLEKLHDELLFVINTLKEQETYTELHDELHEEKVYTSITGDMKISFSGIIDKIKYKKDNNKTIIAIIDYKTGSVDIDLSTIPYGIGMQLPIYIYLAKNNKKLDHIEVAGFYLQHILNEEIKLDGDKEQEELKKKQLLLQGYSNSDLDLLSTFDNTYNKSLLISSMSITKKNEISKKAHVLSSEAIDKLSNIAEDNIKIAAEKISKAEFNIEPKKIEKTNYGCRFCKYKDICYHTNDNIIELKKLSVDEIIGGEE